MRKWVHSVVVIVALLSMVGVGSLLASNMGFVIAYHLEGPGEESASGTHLVCLPYLPKDGLATARDLIDDIGVEHVVSVGKYLMASDQRQTYTAGGVGVDFVLQPGETYFVTVNTDVDYEIRGSHDPDYVVNFAAADGGVTSASGTNPYCHPYHGVAGTAAGLLDELGSSNVSALSRWLTLSDGLDTYTGIGEGFGIVVGEGYFVHAATDFDHQPEHY